ncbi:hypothetical protein EV702DRAFT_148476 [Suillus placidus]|uniref:Secreted protein n=1 Tax=Suillus placidus TaxID=48579 RepID=A0A9P7CUX9_9AGAM|nr:hypothetical protein EV702DRAFT_148476 [Suillus placidus]
MMIHVVALPSCYFLILFTGTFSPHATPVMTQNGGGYSVFVLQSYMIHLYRFLPFPNCPILVMSLLNSRAPCNDYRALSKPFRLNRRSRYVWALDRTYSLYALGVLAPRPQFSRSDFAYPN